ncbi:MAG: VIT1/CCC1 transporter family protein [Chloroflexota bacterium]
MTVGGWSRAKFFRGFVDGGLSTLGIVIGASSAESAVIVAAGVGGALANAVSNVLSAFSAEGAERYDNLRQVEKAMVDRDLKDTRLEMENSRLTLKAGVIDGIATMFGGAIPILPYIWLQTSQAIFVSTGVVIAAISLIGVHLGRVSRRNIFVSVIKMAFYAILVAVAVYFIQKAIIP